MDAIASRPPDLVLLDVMLPQDEGLNILTQLRQSSDVAVILLTGKRTPKPTGFWASSWGRTTTWSSRSRRPRSPPASPASYDASARRPPPRWRFDGLVIDLGTREVAVNGEVVTTTATEFDLLAFLASSPRQVFSRDQLLDHVWKSSSEWQSPDTVTEHIRRLRRRIQPDPEHPRWIRTVWGVGYRFDP